MPPSTTPAAGLQDLLDLTRDTSTLLTTFQTALSSTSSSNSSTSTTTTPTTAADARLPPPLPLLRDASTLLKAHTTKLGLLLLNRPFTATAIATVLREARGTCVMGLMSVAVAATEGHVDNSSNSNSSVGSSTPPAVIGEEIRRRVLRLLRAFAEMVAEIGRVCEGELEQKEQKQKRKEDGKQEANAHAHALTSTATIWEACDALVSLADLGLAGWLVRQAEGYREMLVDAVGELREWAAETDGEGDDDESNGGFVDEAEEGEEGEEEEEELFAPPPPPLSDTKLREQLSQSLSKLHSLALLYQALIKRRLKTVPDDSSSHNHHNKTIDELMTHLRAIPDEADELAAAFYARDANRAEVCLERCVAAGAAAAGLVARDWRGQEDGFTVWERRWREAVVGGGKGGDGS